MIHFARTKLRPATFTGSCRSGLLIPPLAVIIVSIFLGLILSQVNVIAATSSEAIKDPLVFLAPYERYTITQGPHGYAYGHMAIDLSAGKGAEILSPINGEVLELFIDEIGNPTLVIENKVYRVTLLHGNYTVCVGDQLDAGQVVGTESNQGYTTDMQANPCGGRDCGYHTHINVYDKQLGENINPLDLIEN
jgi:murein DD-endopeptidase MepM/ murein hydrolase activator NlpD